MLSSFIAEAETMKNLPAHPNVVMFRGISLPPDPITIVTDFCDGGSLLSLLRSKRHISNSWKTKAALDIARGMLHLHTSVEGKALIHRDVAARNILLKGNSALVSDFGMARLRAQDDDSSTTRSEVGPVKWMAPELIIEKKYSTASDVYSYGVTLFELTARHAPWPGRDALQAIACVLSGQQMQIPAGCPDSLSRVMLLCWTRNPADRPSFHTICKMLEADLDEDGTFTISGDESHSPADRSANSGEQGNSRATEALR